MPTGGWSRHRYSAGTSAFLKPLTVKIRSPGRGCAIQQTVLSVQLNLHIYAVAPRVTTLSNILVKIFSYCRWYMSQKTYTLLSLIEVEGKIAEDGEIEGDYFLQ